MLSIDAIPTGDADCLAARRSDHSPLEMTIVQTCNGCLKEVDFRYFDNGGLFCLECMKTMPEPQPDWSWIDDAIRSAS